MSIKNARKLGFFAALAMLIGTVIGIGIFFKNESVKKAVDGNGTTWLMAWIVGGILSLSAAVSFSEIGSMKTGKVSGLSGWAEQLLGKKMGYFTRFNHTFFYFGLLVPIFGIFISEAFFQMLISGETISSQPPMWVHIIVGLSITILAIITRVLSTYASGVVQTITTGLKIIPLIIAIIVGISLATTHNITEVGPSNAFKKGSFSFAALFAALPSVLFAYDAFINVAALSEKTKGGTKTISKIVLIGMIGIIIIYSLVAIASIIHNQGTVDGILKDSLPAKWEKGISITVWMFITISAYGVSNGMITVGLTQFEQNVEVETFIGAKTLKKKFGSKNATIIISSIVFLFWMLVYTIPALIMNSDRIIDGMTNYGTLFFFGIYAIVILFYFIKRSKVKSTTKISNILFKISAITAVVGIFTILGFQLFGSQTIEAWKDPTGATPWGFFATGETLPITKIAAFATFAVFLTIFMAFPWINRFAMIKLEKNDPVKDTQKIVEKK